MIRSRNAAAPGKYGYSTISFYIVGLALRFGTTVNGVAVRYFLT
jgi:hypothetical protein